MQVPAPIPPFFPITLPPITPIVHELTGAPKQLAKELGAGAPKLHMLKGVLSWDRVDKQFHVPLVDEGPETRRKFRIEGTPMNTLRTTCVCSVFPYCWVCAEGGFVCYRVLAHDVRVLTCVHNVNLLRSTCLHDKCQLLSAQKFELVWKSMSSNVQASCSSQPAVPETGDVVCGVCTWDCEDESCVRPGQ